MTSPAQRRPPVGSLGSCGGLPDVLGQFWFSFLPSQVLPSLSLPWAFFSETTGRKAPWPPQWAQASPAPHRGEGPPSLSTYSCPTIPPCGPSASRHSWCPHPTTRKMTFQRQAWLSLSSSESITSSLSPSTLHSPAWEEFLPALKWPC